MKSVMVLAAVVLCILSASIVQADLIGTYVDADTSNTTPSSAIVTSGGENDTDNLWYLRTQSEAGGGNVLTSDTGENSPMLTTTVPGLANGLYDVYVVYWNSTNTVDTNWNVRAALAGNSLGAYYRDNGTLTGLTGTGKEQRQALLGSVSVTDGLFSVNIADWDGVTPPPLPAGTSNDMRSWYDGVAYQAIPEPSAFVMLLAGLIGLLAYAWRRRK